jgi:uncharacterized coiled-coil DUF342 family protein
MGAGASTAAAADIAKAKGADAATIAAGVAGLNLNAKDKAILSQALDASLAGDGKSIAENMKSISENEAAIHELSLSVMTNKQGIFEARAMMEENRANIMQNYAAATTGNRQMAVENTDSIFRNRTAILDSLKCKDAVEENFKNSKFNESTVQFLSNQCLLNNRVAKVNKLLSDANGDMIAVNDLVLASNEEIVKFNTEQITTNTNLLAGIQADKATPEANATRIAKNKETIAKIKERNDKYNAEMAALHASIKENREKITANAAEIKERRKAILVNRKTIDENGLKVAGMLRIEKFDDIAAGLDALSAEEKDAIKAALAGGTESEETKANRAKITENEAQLHELHITVMTNKSKLGAVRSIIEENRFLLMKNYSAAFAGNRLMVNGNTDSIFKNRLAILDSLKIDGQVQENFRNTKFNEANIDFLEHRSLINNRVAKANKMMAEANTKMIAANNAIMASNAEVVKFNTAAIETNTKLMTGIGEGQSTPERNAARIAANVEGIKVIRDHADKYDAKVDEAKNAALENRKKIIANSKDIDERRKKILENRAGILENGAKIVAAIRA